MPQRPDDRPGDIWSAVAMRLGADERTAARTGADLEVRYAQPHRSYHTGAHVRAVVAYAEELAVRLVLDRHETDLLIAAACAHDVVYDARPGDDERASAAWAVRALVEGGVHPDTADRVGRLVLTTIAHDAPSGDPVAQALLDADLAVLAAPPDVYSHYVDGVRAEYAHVSDADWCTGRTDLLRGLVGRSTIFASPPARERWEAAARANLAAELDRLTRSAAPR